MKPNKNPYWTFQKSSHSTQIEYHYYVLFSTKLDKDFQALLQSYPNLGFHQRSSHCIHLCSDLMLTIEGDKEKELSPAPECIPEKPLLASFDMDSTLISAEVIDELAREADCFNEVAAITAAAMRGELDFDKSLIKRVACLKGLSIKHLDNVYQRITLSPGADSLLNSLHQWQTYSVILSGGFDYFAQRIKDLLKMNAYQANQLEIENDHLTGCVTGTIINANQKALLFEQLITKLHIKKNQTIAVGDGANDLQVLQAAGLGIAWHAKPTLCKKADISIQHLGLDAISWLWD